jgi:glutathione S-transferase
MMLKILGRKTSSNVQKVLWCCAEIGLAFERTDVGGPFGGNKAPQYLAMNPNAIVRYLAAKHAKGSLYPADLRRRANADRWMDWQQTMLAVPMGILFRAMLRSPPDRVEPAEIDNARRRVTSALTILDAELRRSKYVAGQDLTMADIALGFVPHRWFLLPIERPTMPELERWYGDLCRRPAYREHIVGA